jgi:hypothetical protein
VKLSYHAGQDTMADHAPSAAAAMRRSESPAAARATRARPPCAG